MAEARGQLALGNPGLALEAFRRVLRTEGDNPGAFAGVAACYAAMGRYDLARSNYEAALALSPHDPALLLALAPTLELLGENAEAAEARAEAGRSVPVPRASPLSPSTAAPAPLPANIAGEGRVAQSSTTTVALQSKNMPKTQVQAQAFIPVWSDRHAVAAPASTVTVELPPARPVEHIRAQDIPAVPPVISQVSSVTGPANRSVRVSSAPVRLTSVLPRLERLSPGEVALVTTSAPVWRARLVSRTRLSTTVRWVPVQAATARPNIKLLNAARSAGLAARSRGMLRDRGWRRIEIGDAKQIRARSLVIYPATRVALGRSLAAQFGCASQRGEGEQLVVLLGRDRAGPNSGRT